MNRFSNLLKPKNLLQILLLVVILSVVGSIFFSHFTQNPYIDKLTQQRLHKNELFKTAPNSPIQDKSTFDSLIYYPIDPAYKVVATLKATNDVTPFQIRKTDGATAFYIRAYEATFILFNDSIKVFLYKHTDPSNQSLFFPFTDYTNKKETYKGGRFIDIPFTDFLPEIEIDFNTAYNPYCVYNYKYSCPIPPRENVIKAYIRAGEKRFPLK
jgi:uncharacterized protein (DUF1684 family)